MASKKKFKKYSEINFNSSKRKDFLALVHAYLCNEINITTFTDGIVIGFVQEWNLDEGYFDNSELEIVKEILHACGWYSDDESDHQISNGFYYETDIRGIVFFLYI